ncbi:Uncharacterised protein [Candidatus Norongarragalina meridionalis]|nr:Uncharacterised protein [Candidatus Norongarragalina meridionalis]
MRKVVEAFGKHVVGNVELGALNSIPRDIEDFPPHMRKQVSNGTHKLMWTKFLVNSGDLNLESVLGKIKVRNSFVSGLEGNEPEYPVKMLTGNHLVVIGPPSGQDLLLPVSVFNVVQRTGVARVRRSLSSLLGRRLRPAHAYQPAEY